MQCKKRDNFLVLSLPWYRIDFWLAPGPVKAVHPADYTWYSGDAGESESERMGQMERPPLYPKRKSLVANYIYYNVPFNM